MRSYVLSKSLIGLLSLTNTSLPSQWWLSLINVAATQAVRKEAAEPAMKALVATWEMLALLCRARWVSTVSWIPRAAGLENPHRA